MAEVTENGYQTLRDLIDGTNTGRSWDWHSILDDTSSEVTRVDPSDSRSEWTHGNGSQTLVRETTLTGEDSDITTPVTLSASALHETETDSDNLTEEESFTDATIEGADDEVKVTHEIEVPQV